MTLWEWVAEAADKTRANGHEQLATALGRLPELAVLGDTHRITIELPAALRAATEPGPALGRPLCAVLAARRAYPPPPGRHSGVDEVTELVHAAHADPAHCPPGACPAVIAAACHANIDGPGRTVERELLLTTALEHVEPGTPAYTALTAAFADLLSDVGRPHEAVDFLDTQDQTLRFTVELAVARVRALHLMGRDEEALAVLNRLDNQVPVLSGPDAARDDVHLRIRFERARLLARLARTRRQLVEVAAAALPAVELAQAHPFLRPLWVQAAEDLDAAGVALNDWRLGVRLTGWVRHLSRIGAPCRQLELAVRARLALRRGARWTALSMVEYAQAAVVRCAARTRSPPTSLRSAPVSASSHRRRFRSPQLA